ncbi:MAG: MarR family winged helix-turn-helix transcriptional regulator, partial [Saprospiraceae bacterium]
MQKERNAKKFGAYIDRTMKIIRHNYLQKFKALGVDLTTEQWVIMDILYGQEGLSQQELATTSFKNPPTVSRIIDLLCKKKITERKPFANDRRKHKIFLTDTGIA